MERDLGFLADSELNPSQQCALAARRANHTLRCTRASMATWEKEGSVPLVQPHLEHWDRLGARVREEHRAIGEHPEEGCKDGEGSGGQRV